MAHVAYLTGAQVAKRLAVSPKTIARWAKEGSWRTCAPLAGTAATTPAWSSGSPTS